MQLKDRNWGCQRGCMGCVGCQAGVAVTGKNHGARRFPGWGACAGPGKPKWRPPTQCNGTPDQQLQEPFFGGAAVQNGSSHTNSQARTIIPCLQCSPKGTDCTCQSRKHSGADRGPACLPSSVSGTEDHPHWCDHWPVVIY